MTRPFPLLRSGLLSALLVPLFLLSAAPVQAQSASSQAECEKKYPNPMQFNLCLASLSPVRGRVTADAMPKSAGRGGVGAIRSVRRGGGRVSSQVYLGGTPVQRAPGGRKRATFSVGR